MKTRFTWAGIVATILVIITTFFVGCKQDDMNDVVMYTGQIVYINTTIPFPDVTVKVTDGNNTHCQTQTDAGGAFSLKVRVSEINGSYYLLAGDETCIPKKVGLGGYGQAQVDLGVIEVEGPALPTVVTHPILSVTAEEAILGGEVQTDGRLTVTARGICYGKMQEPSVEGLHTNDGTGKGEFTSTLKNLEHNTIYYARAYATNSKGTAYGEQVKFTTELGVPIVITDSVYRITAHAAKCKGHVESDGGYPVSKKGTCWSKQPDPTVDDECTNDGSGIGEFTSTLSNLVENTTYYIRTYATNATATVYGEQIIITTLDGLAVVTTDSINNITATGFTAFGTVVSDCDIPVTARGFCYATTQYPTIKNAHTTIGKGLGKFQGNIVNINVGTTYYVRAYATNATETVYGEQISVTTLDGLPTVETNQQNTSTATTITTGGKVVDNGGFAITERGICYSTTNSEPNVIDAKVMSGKGNGSFSASLSGLSAATKYYIRAFATNENGTAYGKTESITTKDGNATATLSEITNITALSASASVTVTDAGSAALQSCGICWSTHPNPTIADSKTIAGGKQLNTAYQCNMTELAPNTTYYVRGYAATDIATSYSEQKSFTTNEGLPVVTTSQTTASSTQITSGGSITSDGGYSIVARGVCYSTTNSTPTIEDSYTTAGIGTGTFSSVITTVSVSTTYYVRAYATNSIGTGYGEVVSVTTGNGLPIVTTTNITKNGQTFLSGGNVTDDGGYAVIARGICYGTFPNPDLSATYTHTSDGTGKGYYTSTIGSSVSGTIYVRAYATNANGTTYGNEESVDLDYLSLPTFIFNEKTYRVAPNAPNLMTRDRAIPYCEGLSLYGYSDWRLPTLDELSQMYALRVSIGGFVTSGSSTSSSAPYIYWSSTLYNGYPQTFNFSAGYNSFAPNNACSYNVRPIREEE